MSWREPGDVWGGNIWESTSVSWICLRNLIPTLVNTHTHTHTEGGKRAAAVLSSRLRGRWDGERRVKEGWAGFPPPADSAVKHQSDLCESPRHWSHKDIGSVRSHDCSHHRCCTSLQHKFTGGKCRNRENKLIWKKQNKTGSRGKEILKSSQSSSSSSLSLPLSLCLFNSLSHSLYIKSVWLSIFFVCGLSNSLPPHTHSHTHSHTHTHKHTSLYAAAWTHETLCMRRLVLWIPMSLHFEVRTRGRDRLVPCIFTDPEGL